jgi:hypothetical protein
VEEEIVVGEHRTRVKHYRMRVYPSKIGEIYVTTHQGFYPILPLNVFYDNCEGYENYKLFYLPEQMYSERHGMLLRTKAYLN